MIGADLATQKTGTNQYNKKVGVSLETATSRTKSAGVLAKEMGISR
jgi:hypothetical protein